MLASSFLKNKGVLVSCDFSGAMVNRLQENYSQLEEENDYVRVQGNKYVVDLQTDFCEFSDETCTALKNKCDLESIIKDQGDFRKLVYGCQANNELLPFPDASFGAYIANLSVQIVNNPMN